MVRVARDKFAMMMHSPGRPLWIWLREGWGAGDLRSFFLDNLREGTVCLPGLVAEREAAHLCADWYGQLTGLEYRMHELVAYYLPVFAEYAGPGFLRPAAPEDASFLTGWIADFYRSALKTAPPFEDIGTEREVRTEKNNGKLFIWQECEPVAMGMLCEPNKTTQRLNLIYTRPDRRGQGYGKRITAALAARAQAEERLPVLYTAAGNTAANRLYRSLGFIEAGRLTEVTFMQTK